ncbi:hypothetical protein [Prauserella muralis]|uniref:Uncharacterized protein n=1 Tax=Prauserella muralis TaxID=588067 RepID=A0A2V4B672_9PSEU|nr:hypothetical protein [Prauserella muralis]PXY24635.1 hypothetical protein BAY60_19165 [Prauserella muralis]TWE27676.1 hypothetical protein FHX69_0320 [Prauserella muralis]
MRAHGITYDTGFLRDGTSSREHFHPDVVKRELAIIRDDLHCTAVRVTGGDPERLELAATYAADLGLEVWFSPYPLELDTGELLALLADCAERAERVRQRGAEVVFVAGAELSVMNRGLLPGDTENDRLRVLLDPDERDRLPELVSELSARVNDVLRRAVALVRARFGGRVTYASIPLERVDWALFDIVGVDLYRSAEVAGQFRAGVRGLVAQGKPVAITEFGTAAYRGAGDRGARCMEIVEYDSDSGEPARLDGEYVRDEQGQAAYLRELLEVFDAEGVDSAFAFLFALESFPHRPDGDPRDDLDLASPGIVRVLDDRCGDTYPGLPWEPKAAFTALAEHYRR